MNELLNVRIELSPNTDLVDLKALLRDRGATLLTSRAGEDGRFELVIVIDSEGMERLADALPAGASWRRLGVRGNLS